MKSSLFCFFELFILIRAVSRRGDIARRDKEYIGIWRTTSMGMNQGELKRSIKEDPNLTEQEKGAKLSELRAPYQKMSDEELLSLVRDFVKENGREPMQKDVLYDRELKARFGPWTRMLEKAGTRPVSQRHLDKLERRREKRIRQTKLRKERKVAVNTAVGEVSIDNMQQTFLYDRDDCSFGADR